VLGSEAELLVSLNNTHMVINEQVSV